jgi:hypothetical protein
MTNFKLTDHDAQMGITTTVERVDGRVRIGKTYDAEPMLAEAHAARTATAGERWGEFRKVGEVPMAELAKFYRQDGGLDNKRLLNWVKANPQFCWFEKALK